MNIRLERNPRPPTKVIYPDFRGSRVDRDRGAATVGRQLGESKTQTIVRHRCATPPPVNADQSVCEPTRCEHECPVLGNGIVRGPTVPGPEDAVQHRDRSSSNRHFVEVERNRIKFAPFTEARMVDEMAGG